MASRAYGADDKEARRRAILEAANALFAGGAGELPTAAEVAQAAGLAKGTVYLYFRTKEAIFSTLLEEGWAEVIDLVAVAFTDAGRPGADTVAAFLSRLVSHMARRTDLLRLDALGQGVLMKNLEPAVLLAFKGALYARLQAAGAIVDDALGLPRGRGAQLLTRTYGLTRGLWQSYDESVASGYDVASKYDAGFPGELAEALAEYWRGALSPA